MLQTENVSDSSVWRLCQQYPIWKKLNIKLIMTQTELKNNITILVLEINRLFCLNFLEHAKR